MLIRFAFGLVLSAVFYSAPALAKCELKSKVSDTYTVCTFDPAATKIGVFNLDSEENPLGNFTALRAKLAAENKTLIFATNAGMFGEDLKPIGLYIEQGKTLRKVNRRDGRGNFHLKPNGVFFLKDGKAFVRDTETYLKLGQKPDFATQSGPMLVINGDIHPKFSENGPSEKIRNGVGVTPDGQVIFLKSETSVNFHTFASIFRDELNCPNALFFDGSVSSLYSLELQRNDGFIPLGPMVGIYEMK